MEKALNIVATKEELKEKGEKYFIDNYLKKYGTFEVKVKESCVDSCYYAVFTKTTSINDYYKLYSAHEELFVFGGDTSNSTYKGFKIYEKSQEHGIMSFSHCYYGDSDNYTGTYKVNDSVALRFRIVDKDYDEEIYLQSENDFYQIIMNTREMIREQIELIETMANDKGIAVKELSETYKGILFETMDSNEREIDKIRDWVDYEEYLYVRD